MIDTNVASWLHLNKPQAEPFRPFLTGRLGCLSFATVAELRYGALKANWGERNRRALESFVSRFVVLPGDSAAADWWAVVHRAVADQVDVNDEWIAATALASDPVLPVLTDNVRHFDPIAAAIPELIVLHPTRIQGSQ